MLYPARGKKITVDQSKVLKNRLFQVFLGGHPVYSTSWSSVLSHFIIIRDTQFNTAKLSEVFTVLKND